jgi:hypothetical protein
MRKYICLIIFGLFNYSFLNDFFDKKDFIENNSIISQETFNQNSDEKNLIVFQNNIFENKEKIIYLY